MKKTILAFGIFGLCFKLYAQERPNKTAPLAQQQADANMLKEVAEFVFDLDNFDPDDTWTFHADENSGLLYIDLQSLGERFEQLEVRNAQKELIFKDEYLGELPDNSIYEINFKTWPKGHYVLELRAAEGKALREEFAFGN